jgi:sugar/nucleoside kinase (ribokinase family)
MSTARPTSRAARSRPPRVLVVGDLVLDVVVIPAQPIERGTDVVGRVAIRQGGSAANTARWLGRLGVRTQLVTAVGRDGAGRALVEQVRGDRVVVRATRVAGVRTGRIGVIVGPDGERSFVTDRRAALRLSPDDLQPEWFAGLDLVHLPAYSLLDEPLGLAGRRAVEHARGAGALVSLDLSSAGPLLARGRRAARDLIRATAPDLLLSTEAEAEALLGRYGLDGLVDYAPIVVVKRGARGATVLTRDAEGTLASRFDVATAPIQATDTTGAGDAFDAGFLAGWLVARGAGHPEAVALHRGCLAGHRTAARQLRAVPQELPPG